MLYFVSLLLASDKKLMMIVDDVDILAVSSTTHTQREIDICQERRPLWDVSWP